MINQVDAYLHEGLLLFLLEADEFFGNCIPDVCNYMFQGFAFNWKSQNVLKFSENLPWFSMLQATNIYAGHFHGLYPH